MGKGEDDAAEMEQLVNEILDLLAGRDLKLSTDTLLAALTYITTVIDDGPAEAAGRIDYCIDVLKRAKDSAAFLYEMHHGKKDRRSPWSAP